MKIDWAQRVASRVETTRMPPRGHAMTFAPLPGCLRLQGSGNAKAGSPHARLFARTRKAFHSAVLAIAIAAIATWITTIQLIEAYGGGPQYYGQTTNMDKWESPRPFLLALGGITLVVILLSRVALRSPRDGHPTPPTWRATLPPSRITWFSLRRQRYRNAPPVDRAERDRWRGIR